MSQEWTTRHQVDGWVIPTSAVTVAGSRFKAGPHQYVVLPPYGNGATRYNSREQAMTAARASKKPPRS